jgi:hydroxyacylglutathione hydrolase
LPDHLQVWPAHGAGSACGKGLGAIPSSTVGYEKLFNPALQFRDENEFVRYILADQPEAPKYFAVMKQVNKEGPRVLGPDAAPTSKNASELPEAIDQGSVIDLRAPASFAAAHASGTLNIPAGMLAAWAGWLVDYDKPVSLVAEPGDVAEAVRVLNKIGIDDVAGLFSPSDLAAAELLVESYPNKSPQQLVEAIASGDVQLIDVRSAAEWSSRHIPQAAHHFLGKLPQSLHRLAHNKPVVTQCQSGMRSSVAASLLSNAGFEVINLAGGFAAWQKAELPVEIAEPCETSGACATS